MSKKKLLYIQHVPWSWIKQRPQFIAEELSVYYDITIINTIIPGQKRGKSERNVRFVNIYRLPMDRWRPISIINKYLRRMQFSLLKGQFDIVWLALPGFIDDARRFLSRAKLVYDCMDDHLEFEANKKIADIIFTKEREVCERADYVLASSNYLKEKLINRYNRRDIHVVYNAVSDTLLRTRKQDDAKLSFTFEANYYNISYIGTIAEWFDFGLLEAAIDSDNKIRFHLFGPCLVNIPKKEGIIYHGAVEHSTVFNVMELSDALIMPFVVTELIKSVNPVKLYEYIVSGKPCFAPEYGETLQFSEFVMLYRDREHFLKLLESKKLDSSVRAREERLDFINKNTWKSRAEQIYRIVEC